MARAGIEPEVSPEGEPWEPVRGEPGMARAGIEPEVSPEGEPWEPVRGEPGMARAGIEPATPRFSVVCSTD